MKEQSAFILATCCCTLAVPATAAALSWQSSSPPLLPNLLLAAPLALALFPLAAKVDATTAAARRELGRDEDGGDATAKKVGLFSSPNAAAAAEEEEACSKWDWSAGYLRRCQLNKQTEDCKCRKKKPTLANRCMSNNAAARCTYTPEGGEGEGGAMQGEEMSGTQLCRVDPAGVGFNGTSFQSPTTAAKCYEPSRAHWKLRKSRNRQYWDGVPYFFCGSCELFTIPPPPECRFKAQSKNGVSFDYFGKSVAIDGDIIAVGTFKRRGEASDNSGTTYVFKRNPTESTGKKWDQIWELVPEFSDTAENDFGVNVDVSGNTIVVSSELDGGNGPFSGAGFVFTTGNGGTTWEQQALLITDDGTDEDYFGWSMSIDGDFIVGGAYGDDGEDDDLEDSGSAYVYERNGGTWTQVAKLLAKDGGGAGDYLGWSVDIAMGGTSGDATTTGTIVIGAYGYDDVAKGVDSGAAYIFTQSPDGESWDQTRIIVPADGAEGDYFGWSVSISDDTIAVSAYNADTNGNDSGAVYVFKNIGDNWEQQAKLLPDESGGNDNFGASVSISGSKIVVGADRDNSNGPDSGAVYIFTLTEGTGGTGDGEWVLLNKLTANDGSADDRFGVSAANSGNTVVVGSYQNDDGGVNRGAVYTTDLACTN